MPTKVTIAVTGTLCSDGKIDGPDAVSNGTQAYLSLPDEKEYQTAISEEFPGYNLGDVWLDKPIITVFVHKSNDD